MYELKVGVALCGKPSPLSNVIEKGDLNSSLNGRYRQLGLPDVLAYL